MQTTAITAVDKTENNTTIMGTWLLSNGWRSGDRKSRRRFIRI
ncbi:hypothetical protein [Hallella absiana]|nr:hypothetical protein [Hallella absiana]